MSETSDNDEFEEKTTLATNVPLEVKEILEEQEGYLWESITDAVFNTYGGERLSSPAALERELELTERQLRNTLEEKQDIETKIDRLKQKRTALKERREELLEERETKQDALDALLDDLANSGRSVDPGHGAVKGIARRFFGGEAESERVIDVLKERRDERGLAIADQQFEEGGVQSDHSTDLSFDPGDVE